MTAAMQATSTFRTSFKFPKSVPKWLPGHMYKGMRVMQKQLKNVDCVIEVHDARIPFTGRHRDFKTQFSVAKPHLLILNKKDLADMQWRFDVELALRKDGVDRIIFTDLTGKDPVTSNFRKILPAVHELMRKSDRFNRMDTAEFQIMVVGVPNVGKSTLINRLRQDNFKKGVPAKVGSTAGVTTAVAERIRIFQNPPIYVFDTPGVLEPRLKSNQTLMKLALISSMNDQVIGHQYIADYQLFCLNKMGNFSYVKYFNLPKATDVIEEVLVHIAVTQGFVDKIRLTASKF
ncbi:Mitochondrial GTPase 1 [Halotydeus destructor]|nr:Mitochondrial GTPase 1 [Halotydeus destructor]